MDNKIEFRLYYDDEGDVLCYSCDDLEGKYIVVDNNTYAEGRHDLKIFNGSIVRSILGVVYKLVPGDTGLACAAEDISFVVDSNYSNIIKWGIQQYE
jgi:hypothetical protein